MAGMLMALTLASACSRGPSAEDLQDRIAELEGENGQLRDQLREAAAAQSDQASAAAATREQAPRIAPRDERDTTPDLAEGGDGERDEADNAADRAAQAAEDARAAAEGI